MEQHFPYGPTKRSALTVVALGVFLALGAGFMATQGVQIGRFGQFLSPGASYAVLTLLAMGGGVLTVVGLLILRAGVREVVVTPWVVAAPQGETSRNIIHINTAAIRDIRVVANQYGESSTIVYDGGKLKLVKGNFADPASYLTCMNSIRQAAAAAQQQAHPAPGAY